MNVEFEPRPLTICPGCGRLAWTDDCCPVGGEREIQRIIDRVSGEFRAELTRIKEGSRRG